MFMNLARIILLFALSLVAFQSYAVDLNQATAAQLQQIKGIGPKTADNIIAERTRGGAFDSLQDLSDRVKGIGPKRVVSLKASGLQVGAKATQQSGSPKPK